MDFKLTEDAKDWESSYWIVEALLAITIAAILFVAISVLSTTSSKAEVHICQKTAPKENERRIYCPVLLELNSLYNVLKGMRDTAV